MVEHIHSLAISLVIGLLIGLERERSHPAGAKAMGVRSFILVALLGTLTNIIDHQILTLLITLFAFTAILLAYIRSSAKNHKNSDIGITTEIAAVIVYCLGFMVPLEPILSSILAGIVLLALLERKRLHEFSRHKLKPYEIEAGAILFIIVLGVLPFLPDHTIDPWGFFNPRKFGILICIIAGLQFAGYLSLRLFGHRLGMAMLGLLGGLISSTAVFANLPNLIKTNPHRIRSAMATAVLSVVAMLIEVMIILFTASPQLFYLTLWPISAMIITGILSGIFLLYQEKKSSKEDLSFPNPLDFITILRLTILIGGILILVTLTKNYLGEKAVFFISFLGGLFEIHSVILGNSLLYLSKKLMLSETIISLYIAIIASFISKFFLVWTLTPRYFAWRTSILLLILPTSGIIVLMLENFLA